MMEERIVYYMYVVTKDNAIKAIEFRDEDFELINLMPAKDGMIPASYMEIMMQRISVVDAEVVVKYKEAE